MVYEPYNKKADYGLTPVGIFMSVFWVFVSVCAVLKMAGILLLPWPIVLAPLLIVGFTQALALTVLAIFKIHDWYKSHV